MALFRHEAGGGRDKAGVGQLVLLFGNGGSVSASSQPLFETHFAIAIFVLRLHQLDALVVRARQKQTLGAGLRVSERRMSLLLQSALEGLSVLRSRVWDQGFGFRVSGPGRGLRVKAQRSGLRDEGEGLEGSGVLFVEFVQINTWVDIDACIP